MTAPLVSVVIPTFHRPVGLLRAARSVFGQTALPGGIELVVVDNAPDDGGAAEVLARLRAEAPFPVRIVDERAPGLSHARNAGVAAARGPLIAFLDDDQEAFPSWLAELLDVRGRFGAQVVFGPVTAALPDGGSAARRAYFSRFYARTGPARNGVIDTYYGCGNCLVDRHALALSAAPFDLAANRSGGEDDRLFEALKRRGARFGWAAEAKVTEHVPGSRMRLGYTLRRAFAFGQGPSQICLRARPPRPLKLVMWMAVGAMQAIVCSSLAFLGWLGGDPRALDALDKAAQGLGKLFWFRLVQPKLYGRAPRSARRAAAKPAAKATKAVHDSV